MKHANTQVKSHSSRSITRTLLTSVLTVYFLLTLIITSGQIAAEYQNTRNSLLNDLRNQHYTFASSITRSLWEFNELQTEDLVEGLINVPAISGVIVRDDEQRILVRKGITDSALDFSTLETAGPIPEKQGTFGYYSPLVFEFGNTSQLVGDIILLSNRDVTIERLTPSLILLIFAAIIKSSLLILLFSLAFRFYLRTPLEELIRQIQNFDPESVETSSIQLQQLENNEFSLLEDAYNDLLQRLREHQIQLASAQQELTKANRKLSEQNSVLAQEVAEKTMGISNLMLDLDRRRHELEVRQQSLEHEIHQRRITESKLKQSNKELADSVEFLQQARQQLLNSEKMAALGNLVASISHEVNTPIGIGITASSFLREELLKLQQQFKDDKLTAKQLQNSLNHIAESAELIETNLNRANELMHGFKQVAVDQSSEAMRTVDVKEYVQRIIKTLRPKLQKQNVQVRVNCPNILARFITGGLAQILTNMIVNSLTHGFSEQQSGEITITIQHNEEKLEVSYEDNGIGMSTQALQRIFEPFFTTCRDQGGSGLGTHIIHELVTERLQGEISVASEPGQGLRYHFSFPITLINAT
ncbi:ATP-binding protein [Aliidiomarina iranensis]|uniref:histidine kinase n=1 Tax=Aliidiomarina iranensis TaxID=1434071 RepID=A0A432VVC7_9GAMM|nr:HAMP domain-containing sensor histidine kinase [Aliidiomarina iranensis]RUO20450.1 ATP-binding protein [Aliidiomarina iranensis]